MILQSTLFALLVCGALRAHALTFQVEPKTTLCVYHDVMADELGSMDASWEVVRGVGLTLDGVGVC